MGIIRVQSRYGPRWRVDFRDQTGKRRFRAGPLEEARSEAKRRLRGYVVDVERGTYVHPGTAPEEPQGLTVREAVARFHRDYTGRRGPLRSTYYEQRGVVIVRHLGEVAVANVKLEDVDRFRRLLEGEASAGEISRSTIHKTLSVLGTMLRYWHRWGLIDRNLAADFDKPGEQNVPYRRLTSEEWRRVVAELAGGDYQEHLLPVAVLAVATATRRQEVLGLQWSNVREGFAWIEQGKVGRGKKVPLGAAAMAVLEARRALPVVSPFVFCNAQGRRLNGVRIGTEFTRALRAAGIEPNEEGRPCFHSLRATAASWLAGRHDEYLIARLLGHAKQTVTQGYMTVDAEMLRPLVAELDRQLGYAEDRAAAQDGGNP